MLLQFCHINELVFRLQYSQEILQARNRNGVMNVVLVKTLVVDQEWLNVIGRCAMQKTIAM